MLRDLTQALIACGFDDTGVSEFLTAVLSQDAEFDDCGEVDCKGSTFRHYAVSDPCNAHLLIDAEDRSKTCLLVLPPPTGSYVLESSLFGFIQAHDDYNRSLFDGVETVSFICVSTVGFAQGIPGAVDLPADIKNVAINEGLTFAAKAAALDPALYDAIGDLVSLNGNPVKGVLPDTEVLGRIKPVCDDRALYLHLAWPDLAMDESHLSIGQVELEVDAIVITIPLGYETRGGAELVLGGGLKLPNDKSIHGALTIDLLGGTVLARLSHLSELGNLLTYIGADEPLRKQPDVVGKLFSDPGHGPEQVKIDIKDVWMALDPGADDIAGMVMGLGLSVTTSDALPIVDDYFYFTPTLDMAVTYPAVSDARAFSGRVAGAFILRMGDRETRLNAEITLPDYHVTAALENLPIKDVVGVFGLELPAGLAEAKCDIWVSGDVLEKSFAFELMLENDAQASHGADDANWALSSVRVGIAHDPSGNRFHLGAELEFGGITFDAFGEYADGWSLSCHARGDINITQLTHQLLDATYLPPDHDADLIISSLSLEANWGENTYRFSAHCPSEWKIIDKLGVQLERLDVKKTKDQGFEVDIVAFLSVCEVSILLNGRRDSEGGWSFSGETTRHVKPIDVAKELGAKLPELPEFFESFDIKQLKVSYDTGESKLEFDFAVAFDINGEPVNGALHLVATKENASWKIELLVALDIAGHIVKGRVYSKNDDQAFIGTYTTSDDATLNTYNALQVVDAGLANSLPNVAVKFERLAICYLKMDGQTRFVAGVKLGLNATIDLSNLPLGDVVEGVKLGLENLCLIAASEPITQKQVSLLHKLGGDTATGLLPGPSKENDDDVVISSGMSISADLNLGLEHQTAINLGGDPNAPQGTDEKSALADAQETPEIDGNSSNKEPAAQAMVLEKWFGIEKSIGPLFVSKVGLQYKDEHVGFLVDSGFDLGGVHIGLMGLGVSFPLGDSDDLPQISMRGIELGYSGGPVTINGSFLVRDVEGGKSYDGSAVLKVPSFTVVGFGSYQSIQLSDGHSDPSIFIFATLHAELGGPPFFLVKGLAGGFGYNRDLVLPDIAHVSEFPLIRAVQDAGYLSGGAPGETAQDAIDKLHDYIHTAPGQNWVAAGIKANTYGVLDSALLLSVSFGVDVEVGVVGLATLSLPEDAKPGQEVAFIELGLKATMRPQEGTFAVEGRLTDKSFVLSKDCHLRGGFAFYLWTKGDHSGDFVVTLGGYHPKFDRPAHYPSVPRLGVDWQVTKELHITAEMYFALTPSCIMAGGLLRAVYDSGWVHASFLARADFIMYWEPLHYEGEVQVCINFSADLGLFVFSTELNVQLEFWGPEFSGRLTVHVAAISFAIEFGAPQRTVLPMEIAEFKARYLPPVEASVISLAIVGGLTGMQPVKRKVDGDKETLRYVNSDKLEFSIASAVPLSRLVDGVSLKSHKDTKVDKFGIAPAKLNAIDPELSIALSGPGDTSAVTLSATPEFSNVPAALWDAGSSESQNKPADIPTAKTLRAIVGVKVEIDGKSSASWTQMPTTKQCAIEKSAKLTDRPRAEISTAMPATADGFNAANGVRENLISRLRPEPQKYNFKLTPEYFARLRATPVFCALGTTDEARGQL